MYKLILESVSPALTEGMGAVIGTLGFPIVACIYLAKRYFAQTKEFTDVIKENTKMLTIMAERLGVSKEVYDEDNDK